MSNLYSDILSQIARTRPVTVETVIRGEAGLIADGLQRRLVSGVTPVVDPKGRRLPNSAAIPSTGRQNSWLTCSNPAPGTGRRFWRRTIRRSPLTP